MTIVHKDWGVLAWAVIGALSGCGNPAEDPTGLGETDDALVMACLALPTTAPSAPPPQCSEDAECSGNSYCDECLCRPRPCNLSDPFGSMTQVLPASLEADGIAVEPFGLSALVSAKQGASYDIYRVTRSSPTDPFANPEAVGSLNSAQDERAPWLSPDGLRLYLRRGSDSSATLHVATRTTLTGSFAAPVPLSGTPAVDWNADPFPVLDESQLLYSSEGTTSRDIFQSALSGTTVGAGAAIAGVNDPTHEDSRPVLTRDELTLYLSSRRPGTNGDTDGDIWVATKNPSSNAFAAPVNATTLNTTGRDFPVSLSPDGCTLYLASNRETGLSDTPRYRVYQAKRQATPSQVTVSVLVIGSGSVGAPFSCTANGGTCSVTLPFGSSTVVWADRQATWAGACGPKNLGVANFQTLSTDAIFPFALGGVCTVTFP